MIRFSSKPSNFFNPKRPMPKVGTSPQKSQALLQDTISFGEGYKAKFFQPPQKDIAPYLSLAKEKCRQIGIVKDFLDKQDLLKLLKLKDNEAGNDYITEVVTTLDGEDDLTIKDCAILFASMDKDNTLNITKEEEEHVITNISKEYILKTAHELDFSPQKLAEITTKLENNAFGFIAAETMPLNLLHYPTHDEIGTSWVKGAIDEAKLLMKEHSFPPAQEKRVLSYMMNTLTEGKTFPILEKITHQGNKDVINLKTYSLEASNTSPHIPNPFKESNSKVLACISEATQKLRQVNLLQESITLEVDANSLIEKDAKRQFKNTISYLPPDSYQNIPEEDDNKRFSYTKDHPLVSYYKHTAERIGKNELLLDFINKTGIEELTNPRKFKFALADLSRIIAYELGIQNAFTLEVMDNGLAQGAGACSIGEQHKIVVEPTKILQPFEEMKESVGEEKAAEWYKKFLVKMMFEEQMHYLQHLWVKEFLELGYQKPPTEDPYGLIKDFSLNTFIETTLSPPNALILGGQHKMYHAANSREAFVEVVWPSLFNNEFFL